MYKEIYVSRKTINIQFNLVIFISLLEVNSGIRDHEVISGTAFRELNTLARQTRAMNRFSERETTSNKLIFSLALKWN